VESNSVRGKRISVLLATGLVFSLFCAKITLAAGVLAESSAYVEAYSLVQSESSTHLQRTQKIFENLKRISGRTSRSAKLLVINSPGKPWAIALGDGNIVLSAGALEIIYGQKDLEALTNLRNSISKLSLKLENIKDRELKADEQGFMYAALGGYKTNRVLQTPKGNISFLNHWVQQTHTFVDNSHHSAELRTRFLKQRLGELSEQLDLFDYGVKLAHFARYEDAAYLVEGFSKLYPSKQSLNNSAYINIQLARKLMPPTLAYRFWIPTLLEGEAGLVVDRGIRSELPTQARILLENSVAMLNDAIAMDKTDLVARINLIAAHFYLAEYFHARAAVEDALVLYPNSLQLQGMRALILLEQEPAIDMWPIASQLLEEMADTPNAPENVIFNYARLLAERSRHGRAKKYFKLLLDKGIKIPLVYREIICHEIRDIKDCIKDYGSTRETPSRWKLPLEIGSDIDAPLSKKVLKNWTHKHQRIGPLAFDFFKNAQGDSILAIDYSVELITLKSNVSTSTFELMQETESPDVVLPLSKDELWSFGPVWSARVSNGEVEEVWIAR